MKNPRKKLVEGSKGANPSAKNPSKN